MLPLLSKRKPISSFLFLFPTQHNFLLLTRASITSSPQNPQPNFTISDYLISSFGFSGDKAAKLSKPLSHLRSPQNPDSVRRLFIQQGFSDADVRKLVTSRPKILCSSPDNTLAPNLTALRDIGLSTTALTQLILSNPAAIMSRSAAPTIKFWLDFFGSDETALIKAIHHDNSIVTSAVTRVVAPNISMLRTHGLSTDEIRMVVLRVPRFIKSRAALLDDMLNRAKELGFRPGSNKFGQGLHAMCVSSREGLRKKMELFQKFKWSEEEFLAALRKAPLWATLSVKTLEDKMDFFVGEARCDPSYIAANPVLLTCSLEKRLKPRLQVLRLLESKGLCGDKRGFCCRICLSNMNFVGTYVSPHKELPEVLEAYHAACAT